MFPSLGDTIYLENMSRISNLRPSDNLSSKDANLISEIKLDIEIQQMAVQDSMEETKDRINEIRY